MASVWCATHGVSRIAVGSLGGNPFPDATPTFFENFANSLSIGLDHAIQVEAPYQGLELIKQKLGAETALVQTTSPADFEDSMRDFASRGFNLIFAHGFEFTDAALSVARQFPDTYFVVSSGSASSHNVASVTFKVDQAAYVEGVLAGGLSKSGPIGAVGGIWLPSIRLTFEGFEPGF